MFSAEILSLLPLDSEAGVTDSPPTQLILDRYARHAGQLTLHVRDQIIGLLERRKQSDAECRVVLHGDIARVLTDGLSRVVSQSATADGDIEALVEGPDQTGEALRLRVLIARDEREPLAILQFVFPDR